MNRSIAATLIAASAALALTGCATGYHSAKNPLLGWTGGYWDRPGPGELVKVGFSGNGFSRRATVEDYLLVHCAEVAQSRGKPYFVMYGSIAEAIVRQHVRDRLVTSVTNGMEGVAYMLTEDQPGPDTHATAEVLARYAAIRGPATTPPPEAAR